MEGSGWSLKWLLLWDQRVLPRSELSLRRIHNLNVLLIREAAALQHIHGFPVFEAGRCQVLARSRGRSGLAGRVSGQTVVPLLLGRGGRALAHSLAGLLLPDS